MDRDDYIDDAEMFLDGLVMWRGDEEKGECKCHDEYDEYELPNIIEVYNFAKDVCTKYEPLLKEISLNS